jgi:hypothetical protein
MGWMPTAAMLLVQIGFAGMNQLSKMSLDNGMSPYVLIALPQPYGRRLPRSVRPLLGEVINILVIVSPFHSLELSFPLVTFFEVKILNQDRY